MDKGDQVLQGFYALDTVMLIVLAIAAIGYIANILRLVRPHRDAIMMPMAMIRVAGIFVPPLGMFLGFVPNARYRGIDRW